MIQLLYTLNKTWETSVVLCKNTEKNRLLTKRKAEIIKKALKSKKYTYMHIVIKNKRTANELYSKKK